VKIEAIDLFAKDISEYRFKTIKKIHLKSGVKVLISYVFFQKHSFYALKVKDREKKIERDIVCHFLRAIQDQVFFSCGLGKFGDKVDVALLGKI